MQLPFVKYQSLGNDFILINAQDFFKDKDIDYLNSKAFKHQVIRWCDRHFGIGADGVLLFVYTAENPEVLVYNADGTMGQFSGNGIRCAAHYFNHLYPKKNAFVMMMGSRRVSCFVNAQTQLVTTSLPSGLYQGPHETSLDDELFQGDLCNVGNPHFLIEAPQGLVTGNEAADFKTIKEKLSTIGYALVTHQGMQRQLNIQFFWKIGIKKYRLIPFERGAGMTLACSSGAAALAWVLYTKKIVAQDDELEIIMEGGSLKVKIDADQSICLRAQAVIVFEGVCEI